MPALMSLNESSTAPEEASFPSGVFSPPQNDPEWRLALVDVKWLCLNQQYKQCASRCHQLLETASDPVCVTSLINFKYPSLTFHI
jgi:hypothetical protein